MTTRLVSLQVLLNHQIFCTLILEFSRRQSIFIREKFQKILSKNITGKYILPWRVRNFRCSKGKSITLTRIKNWWGENHKYFKNRFNVDKVIFKLIRDRNVAFQQFLKGKVDRFRLYEPEYWHDKTNSEPFKKGYIYKRWSYNSAPQPSWSITLNKSHDLFKDINVRKAIAHAINVDKVNKTILRGDTLRQQSMWVGYRGYSDPSIKARPMI